jgi:hypothetical protein
MGVSPAGLASGVPIDPVLPDSAPAPEELPLDMSDELEPLDMSDELEPLDMPELPDSGTTGVSPAGLSSGVPIDPVLPDSASAPEEPPLDMPDELPIELDAPVLLLPLALSFIEPHAASDTAQATKAIHLDIDIDLFSLRINDAAVDDAGVHELHILRSSRKVKLPKVPFVTAQL